jgi:hypothetical protein
MRGLATGGTYVAAVDNLRVAFYSKSTIARNQGKVMSLRRILSFIVLAAGVLQATAALAGDYTVSYAFDGTTAEDVAAGATSPLNEEGTRTECEYKKLCSIELSKSNISISFMVPHSRTDAVTIYAEGGRTRSAGCCYFSDGGRRVSRKLTQPLVRLHLYEGRARKGNEFVQNLHLGLLYLQFSNLK